MSKNNSILKGMKQALINAHNTNNNKAISKDFAAGSGCSERAYTSWVTWCNSLYVKLAPWAEKYNDSQIPDEELNKILNEAMPILKQMTKADDKCFVRPTDATFLIGKIHEYGKSNNGTLDVVRGTVAFRRQIECLLGCRIAGNAAVSEDDYNIVVKYEKAVLNKDKANDRLDGYVNSKGEKIVGLKDKLEEAKKILTDMKIACKVTEEVEKKLKNDKKELTVEYPVLTAYVGAVDELTASIKSAEGNISKSDETIKKLAKDYKRIMDSHPEIKTK